MPATIQGPTARPFLAGAATALSIVYVASWLRDWKRQLDKTRAKELQSSSSSETTPRQHHRDETVLMDSPDLDQRMIRKAEGAIKKRTSRLVVVIERCTNDFNYSAILRTVEALGIQHVYIIDPPKKTTPGDLVISNTKGKIVKKATPEEISQRNQHALFAQRASEWLSIHEFDATETCMTELQRLGYTIWATDLSQQASCLTPEGLANVCSFNHNSLQLPSKLAIVFGTEAVGCSNYMLEHSDLRVYLPLVGYADSLNLSVATALVIQQLFHLDSSLKASMSEEERHALRKSWFPKLASQRLLTSKDKKRKTRLASQIMACEDLQTRQELGEPLFDIQLDKLAKLPLLRSELKELEDDLYEKASLAVQDLIQNPPAPLEDMRRADTHRTCFVGRNTKAKNTDAWKDMPATTNVQTHPTTYCYVYHPCCRSQDSESS